MSIKTLNKFQIKRVMENYTYIKNNTNVLNIKQNHGRISKDGTHKIILNK